LEQENNKIPKSFKFGFIGMLRRGAFCKKPPYNPQKTLKKCFKFDLSERGERFFEPKPHRALKPIPAEPKALLGWAFQSFLRSAVQLLLSSASLAKRCETAYV